MVIFLELFFVMFQFNMLTIKFHKSFLQKMLRYTGKLFYKLRQQFASDENKLPIVKNYCIKFASNEIDL